MITVSQLENFKSGSYTAITTKLGTAAEALNSAEGTISGAGQQMTYWEGPAASQANATMANLVTVIVSAPGILASAQDTVAAFVTTISEQQQTLKGLLARATSLGCTWSEDGTLTTPPGQPTNQPPQVCFADPAQEAARVQAQTSYTNAMNAWQAKKTEATHLQTQIQQALQLATAADTRATTDLDAGIKGGADVGKIVTGGDSSGSYATDLWGAAQTIGDGQKWALSFVNQAASLLPKAASGDAGALATLQSMSDLSRDGDFSAALMTKLGAKGLAALPVTMGGQMNDQRSLQSAASHYTSNHFVLGFLADSLASASANPNLDPTFAQSLLSYANQNANSNSLDAKPMSAFWALGQILGASSGQPPYDAQFLNTVGSGIINWDKQMQNNSFGSGWEYTGPFMNAFANNLNLAPGTNLPTNLPMYFGHIDTGGNPMYGLMHAASVSPAGAQALFAPQPGGGENPNLNYVLSGTPWSYDKGGALGGALQAAASGPSATSAAITSDLVHTLATQYQHNSGYAGNMTGLRPAVANILSQPQGIGAINYSVEGYRYTSGGTQNYQDPNGATYLGPVFNSADLGRVLGVVSQDSGAYHTLQTAQVRSMNTGLNQTVAAYRTSGDPSILEQTLNKDTTTLAYLGGVKAAIAQDGANASAADLQQSLTSASYVTQGLSLANFIPGGQVIGIPASVATMVLGDVKGSVQPSTQPTAVGDAQQLSLTGFSRIALANALIQNHVATPSVLPGNEAFYQSTGQLLSPQQLLNNGGAMNSLMEWLGNQKVTGSEDFNQIVNDHMVTGQDLGRIALGSSGG